MRDPSLQPRITRRNALKMAAGAAALPVLIRQSEAADPSVLRVAFAVQQGSDLLHSHAGLSAADQALSTCVIAGPFTCACTPSATNVAAAITISKQKKTAPSGDTHCA